MPEPAHALLVLMTAALLLKHALPLSLPIAYAQKTLTEPIPLLHAPLALPILGHLLDLKTELLADARLTILDVPTRVHALFVLTMVP